MTIPDAKVSGFDFAAAVAAARRDYPAETVRITFVDLSAPEAEKKIGDWLSSAAGMSGEKKEKTTAEWVRKNGFTRLTMTGDILVAIKSDPASHYLQNAAHEPAYVFAHEFGHALTSAGLPQDDSPEAPPHVAARHEIAADVFAVLRGIAAGTMTRQDARNLSLARAMTVPWTHVTSRAIDALLDSKSDDDIRQMTPRAMRDAALDYAGRYTPRPGEIEALSQKLHWVRMEEFVPTPEAPTQGLGDKLRKVFNKIFHGAPKPARQTIMHRVTHEEWLENVADVLQTAAPGTLASHTAAKILSQVFNTGKAGYPAEKTFDVSDAKWDALRRRFGPSPA